MLYRQITTQLYNRTNGIAWDVRRRISWQYTRVNELLWDIRRLRASIRALVSALATGFLTVVVLLACIIILSPEPQRPFPASGSQALDSPDPKFDTPSIYPKLEFLAGSTRVLILHPGRKGQRIECSLEIISLVSDHKLFSALSYAWGDNKKQKSIKVDGHKIPVTESLHAALSAFRHPKEPRTIWVDQICID